MKPTLNKLAVVGLLVFALAPWVGAAYYEHENARLSTETGRKMSGSGPVLSAISWFHEIV